MTPHLARYLVASAVRRGLIQLPQPVERREYPRSRMEPLWQHWRRLAEKQRRLPWGQLTREEQKAYQAMCMRRLRAERKGATWEGPARVQERDRKRNWHGRWMEKAA